MREKAKIRLRVRDSAGVSYRFVDGYFVGIGVDYCEFESGIGQYSTAIVIMDDGKLANVALDDVTLCDS